MLVVDPNKRWSITSIINKCVKHYGWLNEKIDDLSIDIV